MKELQVAGFLDNSLVNGKGLRAVLFLSGCNHHCPGCHNVAMQEFDYGGKANIKDIFKRVKSNIPLIKGITFSGGEPFEQAENLSELAYLLKKEGLNIWCYTGYTFEYIIEHLDKNNGWKELLDNIDILVDGRFEMDKYNHHLKYKGSSNQRIIDVKESILLKHIILDEEV
ncbi:MAG: anaerobic ribonucleoside-triphosphate reductase activating protein [Clostridiaceae bacterium]